MKQLRAILPATASFSGAEASIQQILNALAPDLFGSKPVVLVDEVEKFEKKEMQILADHFPTQSYLLLGARKKVPLASAVEKEGIVLDLSEEKPWDRDKRIAEQLVEKVQKAGKRIASDVLPLLLEQVGGSAHRC